MKNNKLVFGFTIFILLFIFSPFSMAFEGGETEGMRGIQFDDIATIGSSLFASILFILTFVAYKRDKRKRLLYVSMAFLLFAIKGSLIASDIFFPQKGAWLDPTAKFLDFAILLTFFVGILKK